MKHVNKYSINLMWINSHKDEHCKYICNGKSKKDMDYELNQITKWCTANPEAVINFWYDSECATKEAIENTKELVKQISAKVQLRDIREISFVQNNSDIFLESIPVYFRIDFLKLIISLYLMENEELDSVIYTDMSIGDKADKVISKQELFSPESLKNLNQYGMLLGNDGIKRENQFIQTINTPDLIKSLKHAIDSCLLLATNTLNDAINKQDSSTLCSLHKVAYNSTIYNVHIYQLMLQSKKPLTIRADIVNEGIQTEWVDYNPEKHGPIIFGNLFINWKHGCFYFDKDSGQDIALDEIVKLPSGLELHAAIGTYCTVKEPHCKNIERTDLNPGKRGSDHSWFGPLPLPAQKKSFECTLWSNETNKIANKHKIEVNQLKLELNSHKVELNNLINKLQFKHSELEKKGSNNVDYQKLAENVDDLHITLKAQMKFFEDPSASKFQNFHKTCMNEINDLIKNSQHHRGWHQINPIIRAIVGVLAAITVVPALVVMLKSKSGFFQTFFATSKPDTMQIAEELKSKIEEIDNKINPKQPDLHFS
ncbi:MAG: hypothetical protein H0T84_02900 [Tatlockia sp.]|nr:hypothetical protein [Tatlockia sp.]